jgi:hypothetical protein
MSHMMSHIYCLIHIMNTYHTDSETMIRLLTVVFYIATTYRFVSSYQHFGRMYCLHLRSFGKHL